VNLDRAFDATEKTLGSVFHKARFWETHANTPLNDRQHLMLNILLDGFEGKLTSSNGRRSPKPRRTRPYAISTISLSGASLPQTPAAAAAPAIL
jgi:hypothetical protein